MGYILILMISVGLAGPSLSEREESNKKFKKEFKAKYGYEWGSYGFNMDSEWEGIVDTNNPEPPEEELEMDMDQNSEPSMNGGAER